MVELLERPKVLGSQEPRISIIPEGEDHPRWSEVDDFIVALGITLDPWQLLVLRTALRRNGDVWAAFAVACCAPRQNGKNGILEVRELIGPCLLGEKLLIHTAHLADTSKEAFRRLDDLIDANEWLSKMVKHIWRTNGHESIEFVDGRRIRFRTRTRGGGRGFSGSPVFFDESMFLPEVSMGAILPVISAQKDPQVWYMGSAVDQTIMDDGVVFARVRERALNGDTERLAYFEWSLNAETPADVSDGAAMDAESWALSNPAFGIRIQEGYIRAEQRELDPRTFAVERLGVGDWPPVDGAADLLISPEDWADCLDEQSTLVDPIVLTFDVSPDRRTSIVASGRNERGQFGIELIHARAGTGWVAERMAALYQSHAVADVSCDGFGPSAAIAKKIGEAGIKVTLLDSGDYGKACGLFVDHIGEKTLRHLGQSELDAAIRGAKARPLVDRWAWSRTKSTVDISPLVAATLALWSATENDVGTVAIY